MKQHASQADTPQRIQSQLVSLSAGNSDNVSVTRDPGLSQRQLESVDGVIAQRVRTRGGHRVTNTLSLASVASCGRFLGLYVGVTHVTCRL